MAKKKKIFAVGVQRPQAQEIQGAHRDEQYRVEDEKIAYRLASYCPHRNRPGKTRGRKNLHQLRRHCSRETHGRQRRSHAAG